MELAELDQLRRADAAVAPEAGGPANPHDLACRIADRHLPLHCGLRFCWKACWPSLASSVSVNRAIWLSVNDTDSSKPIDSIFFMVYRPRRIAAGDLSSRRCSSQSSLASASSST